LYKTATATHPLPAMPTNQEPKLVTACRRAVVRPLKPQIALRRKPPTVSNEKTIPFSDIWDQHAVVETIIVALASRADFCSPAITSC